MTFRSVKGIKAAHRRGRMMTAALLAGLAATPGVFAATQSEWLNPVSGDWTNAANWSTNPYDPSDGTPGPTDTYAAQVSPAGSPYTITLDPSLLASHFLTVQSLTVDSPDATVNVIDTTSGGILNLSALNVNNGTFQFEGLNGGILNGTAIGGGGGQVNVSYGMLQGVTLNRGISVNYPGTGGVGTTIAGGLTLNNNAVLSTNGGIAFSGAQTLGGTGQVQFNASSGYSTALDIFNGALSIAPGITLNGSGAIHVGANLVNNGIIQTSNPALALWMNSGNGTFINNNIARATNGGMLILASPFDNSHGTLLADNGSITIGGNDFTYKTSQLGTLQTINGGTIALTGTLDNSNATLAVTPTTGNLSLLCSISGGRLVSTGESQINASSLGISDVTVGGNMIVSPYDSSHNGTLEVFSGLTLDGAVISLQSPTRANGTAALLRFDQNAAVVSGTGQIVFKAGTANALISPGSSLTLGPQIVVRAAGGSGTIGPNASFVNPFAVINQGSIIADGTTSSITAATAITNFGTLQAQNGGMLSVGGSVANSGTIGVSSGGQLFATSLTNTGMALADGGLLQLNGQWTNDKGTITAQNVAHVVFATPPAAFGSVSITDSTLTLAAAPYNTAQINKITLTRATLIKDGGVWDNSNSSFNLTGQDTLSLVNGGTITGGTLNGTSTDQLLMPSGSTGTLDNVVLGINTAVQPGSILTATRVLALNNAALHLQSGPAPAQLSVSPALDGTGEIIFDGSSSPGQVSSTAQTLMVGAGITIRTGIGSGTITAPVINQGLISAESPGQTITFSAPQLVNRGTLNASNGGSLIFSGLANFGAVSVNGPSTLALQGAWSNSGTITANQTTLALGGNFTEAAIGTIKNVGSMINLTGSLDNSNAVLALNDITGSWNLSGGAITGGAIRTSGAASMIVPSSTTSYLNAVSVEGALDFKGGNVISSGGLSLSSDALSGNGQILLMGKAMPADLLPLDSSLNIPPGISVVNSAGAVIGRNGAEIVNGGTISSQAAKARVVILGALSNTGAIAARKNATLLVANPLNLVDGTLNGGTWEVDLGATLDFPNARVLRNDANVKLNGASSRFAAFDSVQDNNGSLTLAGGRNFTTAGAFQNDGVLQLAAPSKFWTQNLVEGSDATLHVTVAGSPASLNFGRMQVVNSATLDGALIISTDDGFTPKYGDMYPVVTANQIIGHFASISTVYGIQPDISPSPAGQYIPIYGSHGVSLEYVPEPAIPLFFSFGLLLVLLKRRPPVA